MGTEKETANTTKTSHARPSRAVADDDSQEIAAKYRRYEKEYLRRINHKYFSGTTFSAEPVFEGSVTIDGFSFKESKIPPLKKFVEGPSVSEDHGRSGVAITDTAPAASSRKNVARKN